MKTRKQRNILGYETFEKEKPISSTFAQTNPMEVMAPLIDIGVEKYRGSLREASFAQAANQDYIPSSQGQGILGTSQIAGPSYAYPANSKFGNVGLDEHCRGTSGGIDRSIMPNGSYHRRSQMGQSAQRLTSNSEMDRSVIRRGLVPCQLNRPEASDRSRDDVAGFQSPRSRQAFGQAHLSTGQPQGPSTAFISRDPSPTGATRSTARVVSPTPDTEGLTDNEDEDVVRYKCRCMERVYKCKRRRCYDDRDPRCLPMPFAPCRYFY